MRLVLVLAAMASFATAGSTQSAELGPGTRVVTSPGTRSIDYARPGAQMFMADGAGGAYLVYSEGILLRLMRVDSNARRRLDWPAEGMPTIDPLAPFESCCLQRPALVRSDNCVIVAMDSPGGPVAARYDPAASLTPGWSPGGSYPGVYFHRTGWASGVVDAATDGEGGVLLVASLSPLSTSFTTKTIAVTRIRSDGSFRYPWSSEFPYTLTTNGYVFGAPVMTSDGNLGAYVAWDDSTGPGLRRVRLVRFDGGSVPAAGWTLPGIVVYDGPGDGSGWPVALAADGSGGVLVAWDESISGTREIRIQRIQPNSAPAPGWPAGGVVVSAGNGLDCLHPQIVSDGGGGVYVTWHVAGTGAFFTHVLADGTIAPGSWGIGGRAPLPAPRTDPYATMTLVGDGQGGVVMAWAAYDAQANTQAITVQRFSADASVAPGWPADGYSTSWVNGDLVGSKPLVAVSGARVLIAWCQGPGGGSGNELRTVAIGLDGVLPTTIAPGLSIRFVLVEPQPTSGAVRALLSLPTGGDVFPEVVDLTGRRIRSMPAWRGRSAGVHEVPWDGRDDAGRDVRSGIYLLRVRVVGSAPGRAAARVVIAR